jgi:hypothetical protein
MQLGLGPSRVGAVAEVKVEDDLVDEAHELLTECHHDTSHTLIQPHCIAEHPEPRVGSPPEVGYQPQYHYSASVRVAADLH